MTPRRIEVVRNGPDAYDLKVDGAALMSAESFTIVDAVASALRGEPSPPNTEIEEVADAIRVGLEG